MLKKLLKSRLFWYATVYALFVLFFVLMGLTGGEDAYRWLFRYDKFSPVRMRAILGSVRFRLVLLVPSLVLGEAARLFVQSKFAHYFREPDPFDHLEQTE